VNISLELENDLVFLKGKLPCLLWRYGQGIKSIKFVRKDRVQNRSEKARDMMKVAAEQLINDNCNQLELVII
jgi:hypothetical protein